MIETIIILNKKGYKTRACCSGHVINRSEVYILFDNYCEDHIRENKPSQFYGGTLIENQDKPFAVSSVVPVDHSYIDKIDIILDRNKVLYEWASNLPDIQIPTEKSPESIKYV